jgi:gluconokinase
LCLELAGIREEQLSSLSSPLTLHKGLNHEQARQMGLPKDVLVVLGSSDAVNSSLGAGAVSPWQATCMVGTSGALRVISPRPILDKKVEAGATPSMNAIGCGRCHQQRPSGLVG